MNVRILFLTDGIFPFVIGGMQKHSLLLSRMIAERGVQLTIVHPGGQGYTPEEFTRHYPDDAHISEVLVPFIDKGKLPGHYIRANKRYSKLIYQHLQGQLSRYDLIYAQGFTGWYFIKLRKEGKIIPPVFLNFHGYEMFQKAPSSKVLLEYKMLRPLVRWCVRNADFVYSFGGYIDDILRDTGVGEEKLLQQTNGIDPSWVVEQVYSSEIRKFVFVGRYERRKGIEELHAVMQRLINENQRFEFIVIGPIPEEYKIQNACIKYLGEIRDPEQIKNTLRSSDYLVCPSHAEGMPTVILEGMASGLAVIGTRVGAVERMISGNGYLIDSENLEENLYKAFMDAIQLSEEALLDQKTNSLKLVKEEFVWPKVVDEAMASFKSAHS